MQHIFEQNLAQMKLSSCKKRGIAQDNTDSEIKDFDMASELNSGNINNPLSAFSPFKFTISPQRVQHIGEVNSPTEPSAMTVNNPEEEALPDKDPQTFKLRPTEIACSPNYIKEKIQEDC